MDQVIMPELISPKLADMISSNPDILKMLVSNLPGEKVIVGQDCTLDCRGNPTNVKLVLCNVTIGVDSTDDECDKDCGCWDKEEEKEHCDKHCHKIDFKDISRGGMPFSKLPIDVGSLMLEMAVLEAKRIEILKILKLIPRHIFNRKLIARCKREVLEAEEQLAEKRRRLEYTVDI